jgi:hypothetical protein
VLTRPPFRSGAKTINSKRPIDRQREAGGFMDIGIPDDPSPARQAFAVGGSFLVIKERGIYAIKLADEIDPGRTNPEVPNAQQRLLAYGTDSILVRQTLLTAKRLLNPTYLATSVDHDAALVAAFEFLKHLAAMQDMASAFVSAENAAKLLDHRSTDGSVVLPSVGDVRTPCAAFIQKADHSLKPLFGVVKQFYARNGAEHWEKGDWLESLATLVKRRYGSGDEFYKFVDAVILPVLRFVRNARNSVEHPNAAQRMIASDFALSSQLHIVPPSIEIVHPKTPQPAMPISGYMSDAIKSLGAIFELLITFLCERHIKQDSPLPFQIVELPEDWQASQYVRWSWGLYDGERVIPAG